MGLFDYLGNWVDMGRGESAFVPQRTPDMTQGHWQQLGQGAVWAPNAATDEPPVPQQPPQQSKLGLFDTPPEDILPFWNELRNLGGFVGKQINPPPAVPSPQEQAAITNNARILAQPKKEVPNEVPASKEPSSYIRVGLNGEELRDYTPGSISSAEAAPYRSSGFGTTSPRSGPGAASMMGAGVTYTPPQTELERAQAEQALKVAKMPPGEAASLGKPNQPMQVVQAATQYVDPDGSYVASLVSRAKAAAQAQGKPFDDNAAVADAISRRQQAIARAIELLQARPTFVGG